MRGTIHTVKDRGFGFIRADDGRDLFFHLSGLSAELEFDEQLIERRVEFGTRQTERGLQAVDIRPESRP